MDEQYFHVSRRHDLTSLKPSRFDHRGRMPEPAVFITTREHISSWAAYIRDRHPERALYLYSVYLPEGSRIEEGSDGAARGDFKVVTGDHVHCEFLYEL